MRIDGRSRRLRTEILAALVAALLVLGSGAGAASATPPPDRGPEAVCNSYIPTRGYTPTNEVYPDCGRCMVAAAQREATGNWRAWCFGSLGEQQRELWVYCIVCRQPLAVKYSSRFLEFR